jgi:hypothetical protein
MDLLGSLFLFIALGLISYMFVSRNRSEQQTVPPSIEKNKIIKEELVRRKEIIDRVDVFLKDSKFIDPIAQWHNEPIYKYVFNAGYLYEFEDIMAPTNQSIGMDEDFLCFKQLCYKRVNNPVDFLDKFSDKIAPEPINL